MSTLSIVKLLVLLLYSGLPKGASSSFLLHLHRLLFFLSSSSSLSTSLSLLLILLIFFFSSLSSSSLSSSSSYAFRVSLQIVFLALLFYIILNLSKLQICQFWFRVQVYINWNYF